MIAFDAAHKAVLLHVNHPPAGATTMIVSLGILAKPGYLPIIEIAVLLLAAQAFAINRLAGLPYPIWGIHIHPTRGSQ
jgi:CBS domain-containing membrane protein